MTTETLVHLRVSAATKARWVRQSRAAGMRLTDWIVHRVEAPTMPKITPESFAALAQLLRLRGGAAQEVARLVLVDGLSVSDASARTGLELRAAYYAVERAKQGLELARNATGCSSSPA